jgi:hypothetical protein
VVKSSIFFLCRWSKVMQRTVSLKLEHVMFNPKDVIYQPLDNPRVYIIKSGKIDIFATRNGRRRGLNNRLRTIEASLSQEVSDNCYGYTAAIASRPLKMYAIAEDVTSAYYLTKKMFLEAISEYVTDYEYYSELKDKIDLSSCCEAIEAPLLESSKHHYYPTKYMVLRKDQQKGKDQRRMSCLRT